MDAHSIISHIASAELASIVILIYTLLLIRNAHKANRILILFILSISSPLFLSMLSGLFPLLGGVFFCFSVSAMSVAGAFIFIYVDRLSDKRTASKLRYLLMLVPFPVIFMLMMLVFPSRPLEAERPVLSHAIAWTAGASFVISTVHLIFSFISIRKYSSDIENWFSDTEKVSILWLRKINVLTLVLFLVWNISFGTEVFGLVERNFVIPGTHLVFIALIVFIALYHVIRQPDIFRTNSNITMALDSFDELVKDKTKYAKQSITEDDQLRYLETLREFMDRQKPYLDADITIRDLSESVGIPIHHLSIVINSRLGKNFTAFINEYRIHEVKDIIAAEAGGGDINILNIAFRAGFNSKSSFNNVFKKLTGKTPSQYMKAVAADRSPAA
jgi:AraC-like DNA-binding protein